MLPGLNARRPKTLSLSRPVDHRDLASALCHLPCHIAVDDTFSLDQVSVDFQEVFFEWCGVGDDSAAECGAGSWNIGESCHEAASCEGFCYADGLAGVSEWLDDFCGDVEETLGVSFCECVFCCHDLSKRDNLRLLEGMCMYCVIDLLSWISSSQNRGALCTEWMWDVDCAEWLYNGTDIDGIAFQA